MRVRYLASPEITGDSSSFNMAGLGEVIVYYGDGSASSEEISELEVYLDSQQRWAPMGEALRNNDLISDNRVTRFLEPRTPAERERGFTSA
jgi:hypothetical protein